MNLANKVTILRVLLIPVFIILMEINSFYADLSALLVFIIASLTDVLDGKIARKYNLVTTLGIFLDPLADKLLVTSAFVGFVAIYTLNIPAWMVICIISREFIITGLRSIAASKNIIIPASMSGKFKTASQMFTIITILTIITINSTIAKFYYTTPYELMEGNGLQHIVGLTLIHAPYWLMFVTTILTLYSGISYLVAHKHIFSDNK